MTLLIKLSLVSLMLRHVAVNDEKLEDFIKMRQIAYDANAIAKELIDNMIIKLDSMQSK